MNTWKSNYLLKHSVAHYASCHGTDAIHVVWSESDRPSSRLKNYLNNIMIEKSRTTRKPNFKFNVNEEDNLNNRFKPIKDLRTDAIFSVDDDIIVPCDALDFTFTVWQTAPSTMVGFVSRMHWLSEKEKNAKEIVLKAMGQAISKIVAISEIIKKRIPHLHQDIVISSISITDFWEPIEEGLNNASGNTASSINDLYHPFN